VRHLTADDLELDLEAYGARRDAARAATIALKKVRRVSLGDVVTVLFESHATLRHQVQEMLFVEQITDPEAISEELATYAPLLPTDHELSATVFLEMPDMATLKAELPRFVGIEGSFSLDVGGRTVRGIGEGGRSRDDYTSTVHYVRFLFDDESRAAFLDPSVPVALVVEHPAYTDSATLSQALRSSLAEDLTVR
jgi:hypothetical protein